MPEKILSASVIRQGINATGGLSDTWVVRDIVRPSTLIEPFQTPFLNYLFLSKRVRWRQTANPKGLAEFPERELVPTVDTVLGVSAGGSGTITLTPGQPNLYVVGKAIKFLETNETGIVTTAGATPIITRDPSSAGAARTWTAPSVNSKVKLLGEARSENDSTIEAVFMDPVMRTAAVQLNEKSIKMTDMMIAATTHGGTYGGDWWAMQNQDTIAAMKIDLENQLWFNENYFTDTLLVSGYRTTKSEGVIYQIENNGGQILPYGATLDKADWKEWLRMMKLGGKKKTVFAGDNVVNTIYDIVEEKYVNHGPVSRYGPIEGDDVIEVLTIRDAGLIVDIIRNPQWDEKYQDYAVALDDDYMFGLYYAPDKKGPRKFRIEVGVQADGTPREESKILAHIGAGVGNCPACGVLKP
jgi:hypothetical protein